MKKFKYKLAYYPKDKQEAFELIEVLNTLDYVPPKYVDLDFTDEYKVLITHFGLDSNKYGINHNASICELMTNKDLFLALAAMTDDEEFHVGEYVIRTKDYHFGMKPGDIAKVTRVTIGETIFLDCTASDIGHSRLNLRKATKEEIVSHFTKQEPKQDNTMEFTIEGSTALKEALVKESGYELQYTDVINHELIGNLSGGKENTLYAITAKRSTHYVLPQDYSKVLDLLQSLNKPKYVEVIKGVSSAFATKKSEIGDRFKVKSIEDSKDFISDKYYTSEEGHRVNVEYCKEITEEEFNKPKEVKLTITTDNGDHIIVVSKDGIHLYGYAGYKISISELESLKEHMLTSKLHVKHKFKVDIGCKSQIKGVSSGNIITIINAYNKHFN